MTAPSPGPDTVPGAGDTPTGFDTGRRWRLHPRVALRPEPFGALAYHYDNRRLNFLRSPDLVALVRRLGDHPTPRAAFDACGLDERRWPAFHTALAALARSDFLEPASAPGQATGEASDRSAIR